MRDSQLAKIVEVVRRIARDFDALADALDPHTVTAAKGKNAPRQPRRAPPRPAAPLDENAAAIADRALLQRGFPVRRDGRGTSPR